MKKPAGIYKILNNKNGKIYIGSSFDIYGRWSYHKRRLKNNNHDNEYLQNSYNKHDESSFEYLIIEEIDRERLLEREQFWIDELSVCNRAIGYNILEKAKGGPNKKHITCKLKGCNKPYLSKGLCNMHYRRMKRHGDTSDVCISGQPHIKNRGCGVDDCNGAHDSLGYCQNHAYYFRKYGKIKEPSVIINPDRGCKINNCSNKHQGKGLCKKHYERARYNKNQGYNNKWSKLL